ncbi:MAG: glycyl-radical enzyme activating protein [Clostridia bacterium]|nr:glycyl-radical enzyme activating protein [Clostridia bacterium]
MTGTVFNIERGSFVDGPGIRSVVFFKGCNLQCKWCHNPESWSFHPQMLFYEERCSGCGTCKDVCPNGMQTCKLCGKCARFCPQDARKICGKEYTVDELFREIEKDKTYYETSGGGVTFSGGECMLQPRFLNAIAQKCKENGIFTAVDTAGCVQWQAFEEILPYVDLFLYDIKAMTSSLHKEWTGQDNRLILDNLANLLRLCHEKIYIRMPLVKDVNDTDKEIEQILAFFSKYGKPKEVKLLPYHRLGKAKAAAANMPFTEYAPPSKERLQEIIEKYKGIGVYAYVD